MTLLGISMGVASLLTKRGHFSAELSRKSIHIVTGILCSILPWTIQHSASVHILALLSCLFILILKKTKQRNHFGRSIFSIDRLSIGEFLFPLSVAWIFSLSTHEKLHFVIPILILTFADAFAALIGSKYGNIKYSTTSGNKTLVGSITFFITSFLCCFIPLYFFSSQDQLHTFLISLAVSSVVTLLEGASGHGLDNLFIPISSFITLELYTNSSETDLSIRLLVISILLIILTLTKKLNTMNGGGLIGSIFLGYTAFGLGGSVTSAVIKLGNDVCLCISGMNNNSATKNLEKFTSRYDIDRIIHLEEIPLDTRHNAKVDYPKLNRILSNH